MKLFNVSVRVVAVDTGKRFDLTAAVLAKHESEARATAFEGFDDLLLDVHILSVDIIEALDGFMLTGINPI